ncbi:Gfo/Idh/MocA family oxidoreductase [Balneolales bacterium ANBcel1]|nr:Gfo/Idh/MocA family oxidoreductase [Balneolales bacterium ANBcel1]
MDFIRIGILSTAQIGTNMVIPAMKRSSRCRVTAIASRDGEKAESAARRLGIPKHYDSYEALLEDPDIDAIYNPLPNHLHVPLSISAMEAGIHVLCEKPLSMDAREGQMLLDATRDYPALKVMEAFMYRFQPRWDRVRQLVLDGSIGDLKTIHSFFSYYNDNPEDIRNQPGMGGGGLMDIGCYCINSARYLFGCEPGNVSGVTETEPGFGVDRLASGLLDFGTGTAVFSCTMRSPAYQYMKIFGTKGHIHLEWPFTPDLEKESELTLVTSDQTRTESFPPANHYTIMADRFAKSIIHDTAVPIPLEDAVANMKVIDVIHGR